MEPTAIRAVTIVTGLVCSLSGGFRVAAAPGPEPSSQLDGSAQTSIVDEPAEDQPTVSQPPKSQPQSKKPKKTDSDAGAGSDVGRPGVVWAPGPSLRVKNLRLDFKARFQEDFHGSYEGADVTAGLSTFEARRNRIGVEGTLFGHIDFEVERELTEKELTAAEVAEGLTPKPPWKDVNVDVDYIKAVRVQAGRFKIPFGLDELTPISRNDFVYRSLAADYLAPGRDVGVMLHGRFFKRGLNYWAGVFGHDGDNARSKKIAGGDRTFAVRVAGAPLRRVSLAGLDNLDVGVAYTLTSVADDAFRPNGLRARTVMTEDAFFGALYVKGQRRRLEGDLDWRAGRSSVRAEYTYVTDERLGQGLANENLPDARYRSWYVGGTYLVTGEDKQRPVRPDRTFPRHGLGAVELAGRYERLWCDSAGGVGPPLRNPRSATIFPNSDRVVTVGVNWILNRLITLQVNGVREQIEDVQRNPAPNGGAFWSRVFRVQLVL